MDSLDESADGLAELLHAAISQVFEDREGNMVNRWVLGVELIRDDGVRGNTFLASEDMRPWEVIGMHETGSEYARMIMTTEYMELMYESDEEEENTGDV